MPTKERTKENCRSFDGADPRLRGCTPLRTPIRKSEGPQATRTQYYCSRLTPVGLPPLLSREFPRTPDADNGCFVGAAYMPPATYRGNPSTGKGEGCRPPLPLSSTSRLRQSVGAEHARPSTLPLPPRILCIVGRGLDPSAGRWGRCPLHSLPPTSPPYHPTTKKSCPHQRRQDLIGLFIPPRITSDRSPQPRRTVPAAPAGSGSPSGR